MTGGGGMRMGEEGLEGRMVFKTTEILISCNCAVSYMVVQVENYSVSNNIHAGSDQVQSNGRL